MQSDRMKLTVFFSTAASFESSDQVGAFLHRVEYNMRATPRCGKASEPG
jgi:hypothetical protein